MTIKRVNFTGRRRIARDRVDIEVYDGQPRTFDATINLEGLSFLPHAAVYLEATCAGSTVIERFPFGEVGSVQPPPSRGLARCPFRKFTASSNRYQPRTYGTRAGEGLTKRTSRLEGENVFFTLKVVERTERFGRILGIAEHIRPQRAGKQTVTSRRGILPIEPAELGQRLWKLELHNEHDVFLLINNNAPGLIERVRSDPLFYAAIYPEVVRRILDAAIRKNVELDEEDELWPVLWLRFGKELHPTKQSPPKAGDEEEDIENWIEEVVDSFCEAHALKDKFLAATIGNGGES
jgi:hypothetical protein